MSKLSTVAWHQVLGFYLSRAESFRAFFPEGDELGAGKDLFLELPGISLGEWEGMPGCLAVSGPLGEQARELILRLQRPESPVRLWSFELRHGTAVLLQLEDFHVCLVFPTASELQELIALGFDVSLLEPLGPGGLPPGAEVVPLTEDELMILRKQLLDPTPDGDDKE